MIPIISNSICRSKFNPLLNNCDYASAFSLSTTGAGAVAQLTTDGGLTVVELDTGTTAGVDAYLELTNEGKPVGIVAPYNYEIKLKMTNIATSGSFLLIQFFNSNQNFFTFQIYNQKLYIYDAALGYQEVWSSIMTTGVWIVLKFRTYKSGSDNYCEIFKNGSSVATKRCNYTTGGGTNCYIQATKGSGVTTRTRALIDYIYTTQV